MLVVLLGVIIDMGSHEAIVVSVAHSHLCQSDKAFDIHTTAKETTRVCVLIACLDKLVSLESCLPIPSQMLV